VTEPLDMKLIGGVLDQAIYDDLFPSQYQKIASVVQTARRVRELLEQEQLPGRFSHPILVELQAVLDELDGVHEPREFLTVKDLDCPTCHEPATTVRERGIRAETIRLITPGFPRAREFSLGPCGHSIDMLNINSESQVVTVGNGDRHSHGSFFNTFDSVERGEL
jgi:hypothetical protein